MQTCNTRAFTQHFNHPPPPTPQHPPSNPLLGGGDDFGNKADLKYYV